MRTRKQCARKEIGAEAKESPFRGSGRVGGNDTDLFYLATAALLIDDIIYFISAVLVSKMGLVQDLN